MGRLLSVVEEFLDNDEWNYERIEGKDILKAGVRADNGVYLIFFDIKEEPQQVILYVIYEENVPEDRRIDVAEYLTRANYPLIIGNFEMDFRDGEVRYKVSVDIEGGMLMPKMVENMISAGVRTADWFHPGLVSVIEGQQSPEDAIASLQPN